MRSLLYLALGLLFAPLPCGVAYAQDDAPPASDAPGEPTPAEGEGDAARDVALDQAEARAHFSLARVHYERGRFEEAAREFDAAYAISPQPELLFNVFLAHRDGGRLADAADALDRLLALPELPPSLSRAFLESRRTALEASIAEHQAMEARLAAQEQALAEARQQQSEAPEETPSEGGGPWVGGWVIAGIGAALTVTGAITGAVALDLYGSVTARCTGNACPADTEGDRATGEALTITTDVLLPVGVLAVGAGVLLAFLLADEAESVAAACTTDGCAAAVRGTF